MEHNTDTYDWAEDAACSGLGPDDWFSDDPVAIARAKAICVGCPVSGPCLEEATEVDGIRGGLTPRERTLLPISEASA